MSGPMDPERLAELRESIESRDLQITIGLFKALSDLLADRDHWEAEAKRYRARCHVTAEDVEAAGVTEGQARACLDKNGWRFYKHEDGASHWLNSGMNKCILDCDLASSIAETCESMSGLLGRPDILDEMAAIEVDP